jgi:hypothetical protein
MKKKRPFVPSFSPSKMLFFAAPRYGKGVKM